MLDLALSLSKINMALAELKSIPLETSQLSGYNTVPPDQDSDRTI